jgi:hypothetical protein
MCMTSSSSFPPLPVITLHFFLDNSGIGGFGMWPAQFLAPPPGVAAPHC